MYRKKNFKCWIVFFSIFCTLLAATTVNAETPEQRIQAYSEAIKRNPDDAPSYMERGLAYSESGNYKEAIKDFDKAVKLIPSNCPNYLSEAYYNRGLNYYLLGEQAIGKFNFTLTSSSQNFFYAIQDYNQAINLNPNYADAYKQRALAFTMLGQPRLLKQVMEDYKKALELNPNDAETYFNIGNLCLVVLKEYSQAVESYNCAIELNPSNCPNYLSEAYYNRGIAYANLGKYDLAVADATKVIELDQNVINAYKFRGKCYKKLGENEKAQADFAKAKKLEKKH